HDERQMKRRSRGDVITEPRCQPRPRTPPTRISSGLGHLGSTLETSRRADWTACCEDRRVRSASCKREVRDRGASPPSRALRGLEPTRILSAADGGAPPARYVQARVPKCDIRPSAEQRHGSRVLEPALPEVWHRVAWVRG